MHTAPTQEQSGVSKELSRVLMHSRSAGSHAPAAEVSVLSEAACAMQDTVTTPDGVRKGATLSLILLSLLILLPLATGGDPTNPPSISL